MNSMFRVVSSWRNGSMRQIVSCENCISRVYNHKNIPICMAFPKINSDGFETTEYARTTGACGEHGQLFRPFYIEDVQIKPTHYPINVSCVYPNTNGVSNNDESISPQ